MTTPIDQSALIRELVKALQSLVCADDTGELSNDEFDGARIVLDKVPAEYLEER